MVRGDTGDGDTREEIEYSDGGDVDVILTSYEEGVVPHPTEGVDAIVALNREKISNTSVGC